MHIGNITEFQHVRLLMIVRVSLSMDTGFDAVTLDMQG